MNGTCTVRSEIDYHEALQSMCYLGHRRDGKDITGHDLFELAAVVEAMRRKYEAAHKET
jgi:hypothetical protein